MANMTNAEAFDSMFGDIVDEDQSTGIEEISVKQLHEFKNHPFKIKDDESFKGLVESIREYGIMEPITIRPRKKGVGYEIISGHRRWTAAKKVGLEKVPVIIKDVDDPTAVIMMVDGNKKREKLDPSELAFAFKMRFDAVDAKHQGKSDGNSDRTTARIGKDYGMSERNVSNYIRLTELLPDLLDAVDNKKLNMGTAVEISYLSRDKQEVILEYYYQQGKFPGKEAVKLFREKDTVTPADISEGIEKQGKKKGSYLDRFSEYFPETFTDDEKLEVITELLAGWKREKSSGLSM